MSGKRDEQAMKKMIDIFLKTQQDEHVVHEVVQRLELHIVGTDAYVTSYTRGVFDKNFGAPVMAISTKTHIESKSVFLYPAKDPGVRGAKRLRSSESMGPAYVAFGVPLRKLNLKFDSTRQVVLPLEPVEVPEMGTAYLASFADIEVNRRDLDQVVLANTRKAKTAEAKAKKEAKRAPKAPKGTPPKSA